VKLGLTPFGQSQQNIITERQQLINQLLQGLVGGGGQGQFDTSSLLSLFGGIPQVDTEARRAIARENTAEETLRATKAFTGSGRDITSTALQERILPEITRKGSLTESAIAEQAQEQVIRAALARAQAITQSATSQQDNRMRMIMALLGGGG